MIKFTTINVDGIKITREFNTVEEIKKDWYSDDCTLPANDDEIIYAELDGIQLHYPKIFEDLLDELGIINEETINRKIIDKCYQDCLHHNIPVSPSDVKDFIEDLSCECGNKTYIDGFFPCDEFGIQIIPTKENNWNGLYVCSRCGKIHDINVF